MDTTQIYSKFRWLIYRYVSGFVTASPAFSPRLKLRLRLRLRRCVSELSLSGDGLPIMITLLRLLENE